MYSSVESDCSISNNFDSNTKIKCRGASLNTFKHDEYLSSSGRVKLTKRNSDLDGIGFENNQTGSGKLMNLIKSGFHLSKYKSKSKVNLQERRQSLRFDSLSSKSEENLQQFVIDSYLSPIRVSNILLNPNNPILYTIVFTSDGDSFYKELVVLDKNCSVQIVHPSIVCGENFCFQIIKRLQTDMTSKSFFNMSMPITNGHGTCPEVSKSNSFAGARYRDDKLSSSSNGPVVIVKCQCDNQRSEWIMRLKKHINPKLNHMVRHEDTLRIWIQEAKNLSPKRRYFCEIKLDQILYGRTTTKYMNETVFWGEQFQFPGLKTVREVTISIYRILETKKKKDKTDLIASVNIQCDEIRGNSFIEKWYSCSEDIGKSNGFEETSRNFPGGTPTIRIKARYRPLEIIPIKCYQMLLDCVIENNIALVASMESLTKVKVKEEFVSNILLILETRKRHLIFLVDLVLMEVFKSDPNILLRGNTMASKAMECYLKMIGEKYLSFILSDLIRQVTQEELDCEVDPQRIQNLKDHSVITSNQKKLLSLVETVWKKICNNSHLVPKDLKSVFTMIRDKLGNDGSDSSTGLPMIDQVISSCLFLRYICPAIMSPFLFGLVNEYSEKSCVNRTFTLIAKCIQSLANFSQSYHGKEAYMNFIQDFLTSKTKQMHTFILEISTKTVTSESSSLQEADYIVSLPDFDSSVDLGYQLAELTYQLDFYLQEIPIKDNTPLMMKIRSILKNMFTIFPKLNYHTNERPDNYGASSNFRSLIPVRQFSTSPSLAFDQLDERTKSIQSPSDNGEQFSYIPNKKKPTRHILKDNSPQAIDDNYIDLKLKTDEDFISKSSQSTKILNEKEINTNWNKVVLESNVTRNSTSHDDGYFVSVQSCVSDTQSHNSGQIHSPKLIPSKFHRNSNVNKPTYSSQNRAVSRKLSCPAIRINDTFDLISSNNESDYENKNIKFTSTENYEFIYTVNQSSDSYSSSSDNLQYSTILRSPHNSQTPSNSISCDSDLKSFLMNEIARLELFSQYYNIPIPVIYKGDVAEQNKNKAIDENHLRMFLLKKINPNQVDIINHIKTSYRLLKSLKNLDDISADFTIQSVMEINKRIQDVICHEFFNTKTTNNDGVNGNGQSHVRNIKRSQSQSTQSRSNP